ncbi:unnamed protein product [Dovyalis caffra]|uniref:Uncharacterized protein n=1 Tax=Dovyalis caffra TaxID=77055 RepID=A0AAV1SR87_9ROSI|nr:unnamed protein product [Dovyalis caffra]
MATPLGFLQVRLNTFFIQLQVLSSFILSKARDWMGGLRVPQLQDTVFELMKSRVEEASNSLSAVDVCPREGISTVGQGLIGTCIVDSAQIDEQDKPVPRGHHRLVINAAFIVVEGGLTPTIYKTSKEAKLIKKSR